MSLPRTFNFFDLKLIQSNLSIADTCETLIYCPLLGGVRYREAKLLENKHALLGLSAVELREIPNH